MNRTTARAGLTATLITGTLLLAGCGDDGDAARHASMTDGGDGSAGATAGMTETVNDTDVAFAAGMIPHHEQAIEMARLADGRATDPRVRDLAERIEAAQGPEIDTLTAWLEQWGADPMAGTDHGSMGHGEDGMMSGEEMHALTNSTGTDFDRLFLQLMVEHHRGALQMAETQAADGRDTDAIQMAETIRDAQAAEIAEMQQLLAELGG